MLQEVILGVFLFFGFIGLVTLVSRSSSFGGGTLIDSTSLAFTLRSKKLKGLHVADNWQDWVENWSGSQGGGQS